jgi:glycerol-3-phosphate dehydrogenase
LALGAAWREAARVELARAPYDLLVIGSGIIGAGIANEASRAGLRVALVDRSDFGGATSSASSKLIHGGLRYLRLGDIKLVREAHTERRALLRVVAPHLVRRIPFLFPVYRGGPYRPVTIQAGLWTYSTLAGEKLGGLVKPERARRSVPPLRVGGLRGCGVYQDAWTHDGRLCLANVTAASEAGATVLNFAEVVDLRVIAGKVRGAEVRDRLSGEVVSVEARAVVNATGPWLDTLRRMEEPGVERYGQLSKGVHVTLPLD